ncbi:MAG: HupE/UreJ family protein [Pseudomonadales bacterium]|jgi:hydrogenase/urease accessory protein HupE|nr:HupE/UreJ family protein [Pseudomonadales bacterium]MDP7594129.1 HupE/UreJ family protein [Pseudomonadales bacterium]HJN49434.1 HupE/UreJ family protein [Pseudomonadales bacterium]|tara:strand:- start:27 stop:998 length:972 start_codon:yes stop_codon:yes gene_type:complete
MNRRQLLFLKPFLSLLLLLLLPSSGTADDFRPLYVELREIDEGRYTVRIKRPPRVPLSNHPLVEFPSFCSKQPGRENTYVCSQDVTGATLSIRYPRFRVANSSVIKVSFFSGENHTVTLSSGTLEWRMPKREEIATVAVQYTWLGMEHIWIGSDHLLFVLCLIWIAGSWRRILATITGFTLAHSVTLALAALQVVVLPVPPIEAAIALSVLFLATELTRGSTNSLAWNYPIAVSSSFGLLHGLGFAAVLTEIGLPQTELVTGLVFFNVGVEIGQLLFALAVIAALRFMNRWSWFASQGQTVIGYFAGCVAAYWFIERTAGSMI